ncbi:MAG: hypothetical protein RL346_642 [Verrucomicrobiota bacterium]
MSHTPSDWESSKSIAKGMLRDRTMRRKMLAFWVLLVLAWIAIGKWVIGDWLSDSPMRFLLWWGGCFVITLILMLFALYDALRVLKDD